MVSIAVAAMGSDADSELLSRDDRAFIESLRSDKRRREVRSWRSLLRRRLCELGYEWGSAARILYDGVGAPYFEGRELYFGVSHCRSQVAVIVSDRRCAVDIEELNRNFASVAKRYTTANELERIGGWSDQEKLAVVWSAKEALYKVSGLEELDFVRDIEVVEQEGDKLTGRVRDRSYKLAVELRESVVIVTVVA